MKKWFVLFLTVAMLLTAIPFAMAEENVTLTFAFWDTNQEPGMKAIADAYMAEHPNVTIDVQVTPWGEYWTKLEAGALGQSMPDIFWMHSNQFFKYVTANTLLSLDDLNYDYAPYPEGVTSLYTYEGTHYAIPKDYDTIALVYNKEIFDAAGEPYPDDTWDWAKFLEVAKKLTDPDKGIYGFGAPNDRQSGYLNLIYQNEGFAFEDGKSGYDQPATKGAVQFWVDLQQKEGVSPSQQSFVDMGVDDQMQAGKLAMCFTGSWNMSSYTSNDLFKDKFDLAVLPQGKTRASIYNGLGYAVSAFTKYPDVAKDFVAFCGTEEANKLQAEQKAAIPAYAGTEHYFTDLFTDINIACYTEMIAYGVQYPFSPNKSLWESQEEELMNSVYAGELTVDEACDQLHAIITDIEG